MNSFELVANHGKTFFRATEGLRRGLAGTNVQTSTLNFKITVLSILQLLHCWRYHQKTVFEADISSTLERVPISTLIQIK